MYKIETNATINASINEIWKCLIDTKNYSTWNHFIRKIEGEFSVGNEIKIELFFSNDKIMVFKPICMKVEPPNEIKWQGIFISKFLLIGVHYFKLEKLNENSTKFIHGEIFTGILSGLFKKLLGKVTERAFKIMNKNLSDSCNRSQQ